MEHRFQGKARETMAERTIECARLPGYIAGNKWWGKRGAAEVRARRCRISNLTVRILHATMSDRPCIGCHLCRPFPSPGEIGPITRLSDVQLLRGTEKKGGKWKNTERNGLFIDRSRSFVFRVSNRIPVAISASRG